MQIRKRTWRIACLPLVIVGALLFEQQTISGRHLSNGFRFPGGGLGQTTPVLENEAARSSASPVRLQFDVPVRMSDRTILAADVYLPEKAGRYPVILTRTPYGKTLSSRSAWFFLQHDYAVVIQDVRSRYESDGEWEPFVHEAQDGYETIEWAARQSWSNGKVVTYGGSYPGMDQWLAASKLSPHLAAMIVEVSPSDIYGNFIHIGGAFNFQSAVRWSLINGRHGRLASEMESFDWSKAYLQLPVVSADATYGFDQKFYRDWIEHSTRDSYWRALSWRDAYPHLNISVLNIGGWFDFFQIGNIDNFVQMIHQAPPSVRGAQRLIIGPWPHDPAGEKVDDVDFGPQSVVDLHPKELRWLDHYIKGEQNDAEKDPPVEAFSMGVNRWRSEETWPPRDAKSASFYLHSAGRANGSGGDGVLSSELPAQENSDRFDYDPANPVPTQGGGTCCDPLVLPWGPLDQSALEKRADVLVYSIAPLDRDLDVIGPVKVHLFAASSAPDTDWTTKLVDVAPEGFAMNLTDGILRARFRSSLENPSLLVPQKTYEFIIDNGNTSNVFRKGHRIRLEVSSSNFPHYSRNTNTGRVPETDTAFVVAHQTVFHARGQASYVEMSVRTRL